ncbi:hypothetical protein M422DRAFT_271584 [Sphaerobolus stellatus SS14]|uniref:Uncharacterized protein n=1 Tax=Sphaerobolus stellatus (strain SS14) TaxID=990650 RepID=A0A0C9TDG5_SPHS4|nr:hypothetical protein M422DRAFT_271584 [Sphaerobolus stellatus SS14]
MVTESTNIKITRKQMALEQFLVQIVHQTSIRDELVSGTVKDATLDQVSVIGTIYGIEICKVTDVTSRVGSSTDQAWKTVLTSWRKNSVHAKAKRQSKYIKRDFVRELELLEPSKAYADMGIPEKVVDYDPTAKSTVQLYTVLFEEGNDDLACAFPRKHYKKFKKIGGAHKWTTIPCDQSIIVVDKKGKLLLAVIRKATKHHSCMNDVNKVISNACLDRKTTRISLFYLKPVVVQ